MQKILVNGEWIASKSTGSFTATNPSTGETIATEYPVSSWEDCDKALDAAVQAFDELRSVPTGQLADFMETFAGRIEERSAEICELAFQETGLPVSPRLADVELPRTSNQIRLAATAARQASWAHPTIDTKTGIRSIYAGIGPVAVFGPNNFPLAFGSISGGDFAAALAAGNPVIAKANSSHPGTTRLLAEEALEASVACKMPVGTVQLLYRTSHADGEKMVADARLASVGYTGSRNAGLKLKRIADELGKPIYLELSSINPMIVLPGAINERGEEIAKELAGSCLLGSGQFCTSPGLIVLLDSPESQTFVNNFVDATGAANPGVLLSDGVQKSLEAAVSTLVAAGAESLCGGGVAAGPAIKFENTVLKIDGSTFLKQPETFQTEAFGNASLVVVASNVDQALAVTQSLEGNLTGCIYSHSGAEDETAYQTLAPALRQKVGRLLNDKMPTGVAVSPAMNHGGPYPATGHPGFTAVGMPGAITRFGMLQCYDNVRAHRLPENLRDENPNKILRSIDGVLSNNAV